MATKIIQNYIVQTKGICPCHLYIDGVYKGRYYNEKYAFKTAGLLIDKKERK